MISEDENYRGLSIGEVNCLRVDFLFIQIPYFQ